MKKKIASSLLLSLLFLALNTTARGQFFKDIMNSVKQTAQGRANSKADQTTNKALDKVDSGTRMKGGRSTNNNTTANSDTASSNKLLNAFAQTAADNPNDTSSADLTMKALSRFASGPAVSRQDSITAINSYKTANGGAGVHYLYRMVSTTKKGASQNDSSEIWFTNSGEGRAEIKIPIPGVQMNKMITLGRANQRRFSVLLHPEKNTYSLNVIDTALLNRGSYKVIKIGTETVMGYPCIHARIVGKESKIDKLTTDVWTSTAVPGYSIYNKALSMQTSKPGMAEALENAGCGGFFVKIDIEGSSSSLIQTLITAEETRLPASLFQIPPGYTESDENVMSSLFQSARKK